MRCVSELKGFKSTGRPKMRQSFRIFCKISNKNLFFSQCQRNDYIILVLTIIVVSSDMKRVSGKCING